MEHRNIRITLAGRVYPMTVTAVQEESIRRVAHKIEKMFEVMGESYQVNDRQDILAMIALRLGMETELLNKENETNMKLIHQRLNRSIQALEESLETENVSIDSEPM